VKQKAVWKSLYLVPFFLAVCLTFFYIQTHHTQAAINPYINFQGKLTNPDGTNLTNGSYSIVFSIYTVASGGSNVWTETKSVTVTDGIFQTSLGDTTALPGTVDFNTGTLYLGIKVGTDAEMTPRVMLTAAPYAFNSDKIGGLTSGNFVQMAQGLQTDSSSTNASIAVNKTAATAKIVDLQRGGVAVFTVNNDGSTLVASQTNSATAFQVQTSAAATILTADTSTNEVFVGSNTTDTTQVLLQLDSFDTFADTGTCGATTNQGGLYYNTKSNAVRACVNGSWEDLVSTGGLGLQLFGVVPDSGANPGDLASVTGVQNGPCKVSVGATTTTVSWTACTAYSGGRKVIVAAGTAATTNALANQFQHLCLTGTNGQPVLSTAAAETANLGTVSLPSVTAPIVCLADIKFTGANNTITQIYDTRTYTTTEKQTISIGTTAPAIGHLVQYTATKGVAIPMATLNGSNLAGVVVATTGAVSTTTINAIIATSGPTAVKAITGTNLVNAYIFGTATAGYASTVATKPAETTATIYNLIGSARTAWSGATACTINNDTCAGSILTLIDKR
jgi:hypothetical protein